MSQASSKVVVVFSGGQDSTTCLYWALQQSFQEVHAITFDYGQLHAAEIEAAQKIVSQLGRDVKSFEIIKIGDEALAGTSPLTNKAEALEQYDGTDALPGGLEKTFVPMRNQLFLTIAANRAYCLGATNLVTGVCQEDSGGYPDCRRIFIDAMEVTCSAAAFNGVDGAPRHLTIHTPLMYLTKAQSVDLARRLDGCYKALAHSHTAYDGAYPPTGHDHATLLRQKGFIEANVPDPLVLRAWVSGLMNIPNTPNYDLPRLQVAAAEIGNDALSEAVQHMGSTPKKKKAAK